MPSTLTQPFDDLSDWFGWLREQGFDISVQRQTTVGRWLLQQAGNDEIETENNQWLRVLAPLICRDPKEQQRYQQLVEEWPGRRSVGRPAQSRSDDEGSVEPPPLRGGRLRWWLLSALLCVGLAGWMITVFNSSDYCYRFAPECLCKALHKAEIGPPPSETPVSAPQPPPIAPATGWVQVEQELLTQPKIDLSAVTSIEETAERHWRDWSVALLPLALVLAIFAWQWVRRSDILKRARGDEDDERQRKALRLAAAGTLFDAIDADTAMRAMNQPVTIESTRGALDALDSLNQTARHASPRLVYSASERLPEIVLLVQIGSAGDLRNELADRLTSRLKRNGLRTRTYLFSAHAIWLVPLGEQRGERVSPAALQQRHPHARLLILCEPRRVYDLYGAKLLDWAATFADWQSPLAIMTLEPFESSLARQLQRDGLQLLPLDATGLELLAAPRRVASSEARSLPLHLQETDWPQTEQMAASRYRQLSDFLGDDGLRLLQVLALYPELHLGLAVALDLCLFPKSERRSRQQRLFRILRLPWSRHGWLPDRLRSRLIAEQTSGERAEASDQYRALFQRLGASGQLRLPVARRDGWKTLRLFLGLRGPGERDLVFLSQVVGPRWLNRLAFYLPRTGRLLARLGRHYQALAVSLLAASLLPVVWLAMNPPVQEKAAPLAVSLRYGSDSEALRDRLKAWLLDRGALVPDQPPEDLEPGVRVRVTPARDPLARRLAEDLRRMPSAPAVQVLADLTESDEMVIEVGSPQDQGAGVFRDHFEAKSGESDISIPVNTDSKTEPTLPAKSELELPKMVAIPAGTFDMGSPSDEAQRESDEGPVHRVRIAAFEMSETEVTFEQYDVFAAETKRTPPDDAGSGRGNRPAINVSWDDAIDYIAWLNEKTGDNYRLPTEAEWEYAARAGTTSRYWWGDEIGTNRARCLDCGNETLVIGTVPVASYEANPFGLFDTAGNVWEWTQDCWHGDYTGAPVDGSAWLDADDGDCDRRVLRGGGWVNKPDSLRAANRNRNLRTIAFNNAGFRLARTR